MPPSKNCGRRDCDCNCKKCNWFRMVKDLNVHCRNHANHCHLACTGK